MDTNMMVDPQELVIDLPLNEKKVVEYMQSLSEHGLVQDVVVWLKDNRIIDGFHRTEAARRLGWTELHVLVKDISEEAFWNARIISARQHHEIEASRLTVWMSECWKQTKWYVPISPDKDGLMPRVYSNTSLDLRLVEMVWTVFCKKMSNQWFPKLETLTDDERELRDWALVKSQQWGVTIDQLAEMFLQAAGIRNSFAGRSSMTGQYDEWARDYNLSLKQRLRLQDEIRIAPKRLNMAEERAAEKFIEEKIAADVEDGETYLAFVSRTIEEERKEFDRKEEIVKAEHLQKMQDPAYQEHLRQVEKKAATRVVVETLEGIRKKLRVIQPDLKESPKGAELLMDFFGDVSSLVESLWPERMTADADKGNLQQIAELKHRLTISERENQEMRRALKRSHGKNSRVMAVSSSEIESMVA